MRVQVISVHDHRPLKVRVAPGGGELGEVAVGASGVFLEHPANFSTARAPTDHRTHEWVLVRFDVGLQGFVAAEHLRPRPQPRPAAPSPARRGPAFDVGALSLGGGGSSGGNLVTILVMLALGAACLWWFVTVVLPILLAITAGLLALWVAVKLFRKSAQRYGLAATVKGTAVLFAVFVGGPLGFLAYREAFMGDFEAARDGVVGRASPSARASECGATLDEGDNLDCEGASCKTVDNLEGRWVEVVVGGVRCWAAYRDVRFQHGIVMSLVEHTVGLRTTTEDDAAALSAQRVALDRRTRELASRSAWRELAALGASLADQQVAVPARTAARVEEGASRQHYADVVASLARVAAGDRAPLLEYARGLAAPAAKPELAALERDWDREACRAALDAIAAPTLPVRAALRTLIAAAPSCRDAPDRLDAATRTVLDRLVAEDAPGAQAHGLALLAEHPDLRARLTTETAARLESALGAAREAGRAADLAAAAAPRREAGERVFAARCRLGADGVAPLPARVETRLRGAVERDVRRDLQSYLRTLAAAAPASLVAREAAFLRSRPERPASPPPRGLRVRAVEVSACADRASVSYVHRAGRRAPVTEGTLGMCFLAAARRWDPCPSSGAEAAR